MSNAVWTGLLVGVVLVIGAWLFYTISPEQFANFEKSLATAGAVLGFGVSAAGTFKGGQVLLQENVVWQEAGASGITVLGGAVLMFASSLIGG